MYKIVRKKELNSAVTLMEIEAPFVARKAKAGQFIIFRVDDKSERVPLTIAGYDREKGTVSIIFQKVGLSTELLGSLNEGDYIQDFVGPLGKPTDVEGKKRVCVVGGGNTAMEDALYLAGFCRKVYVLNRSKKFRAAATMVENVKRNGKITVLTDTVVDKFVGSNMLEGVDIRNTVTGEKSILNVSGAIVAIGVKPSSDLAKDCGVECCQHGFVKTDMYLATNITGIFAAGDVRVSPLRQVITAAADGAIAATSAVNYVNELGIKSI